MNVKDMSIHELNTLYQEINKEISRREREQKETAWRKVQEVIAEYLGLYGEIRVETYDNTYYLYKGVKMDEFGVFNMEDISF